jgi:very-short-patch-repair endonuclease
MLALLETANLPKPQVNRPLSGYEPDYFWPAHKLILEFDGYGTHGSRAKFESDRKRDQTFAASGIQTIRATWLQLEYEPVALVVRIGQALAARSIRGR